MTSGGHTRSTVVRRRIFSLVFVLIAAALAGPASPATAAPLTSVLVFSKTAGYRHSSIPLGIEAIRQLGMANGFAVTATEDARKFTKASLARYQVVVWLSTTGDVLNATQQRAFESYIARGGGYVGVHSAADTEYDWAWYGGLVGAYFASHPPIQQATVNVEDRSSVATADLGSTWVRSDEWYNYRTSPRRNVKVLLSIDESTYGGGAMGDHPITWCQDYGGGRAFYTGLGHTEDSYTDPSFRKLLLGGIQIAAGSVPADCRPAAPPLPAIVIPRTRANGRFVAVRARPVLSSAGGR